MWTFVRLIIDTLMYLAAAALCIAAGSWPKVSLKESESALVSWLVIVTFLWVISVPMILTRSIWLYTHRNRATGSINRRNYIALSLALTLIWFALVAHEMTIWGRMVSASLIVLSHYALSYITPVAVHSGGTLGDSN